MPSRPYTLEVPNDLAIFNICFSWNLIEEFIVFVSLLHLTDCKGYYFCLLGGYTAKNC